MDRHRHNNGFTLIEMLLVLLMLSIAFLLFPLMHSPKGTMGLRMNLLQERLLSIQAKAMREGKKITVTFDDDTLVYEDDRYDLGMRCEGSVIFHPNGNVDRARTILCHTHRESRELIVQLGSGRMYVR